MKAIVLSRDEILTCIRDGDWSGGRYYLAVYDGQAHIHGADDTRAGSPWPADAMVAEVPALSPEGEGLELEDARAFLAEKDKLRSATLWAERHQENLISYCLRRYPEEWEKNRASEAAWLADEWIDALNGGPSSMFPDIWGWSTEGESLSPPARFIWGE